MSEQKYFVKCWTACDKDKILPASAAFEYARLLRSQGHTVSCELWRLSEKVLEPARPGAVAK
jgi:hypothetical protein